MPTFIRVIVAVGVRVDDLGLDVHRHLARIDHARVLQLSAHALSTMGSSNLESATRRVRGTGRRIYARVKCKIDIRESFEIENTAIAS